MVFEKALSLYSWNVNGIRAACKKGFWDWLQEVQPDVLGLQETKISAHQLTDEMKAPPGYHTFWSHAERPGYSSVALFTKEKPLAVHYGLGIDRFDREGRVIIGEYPEFTLFNIYHPNGQRDAERLQYKLDFYDAFLAHVDALRDQGKPLVMCGDYNTAHQPIDLARPKANEKTSGFLPVERAWMDRYTEHGYLDTFRLFYPDKPDEYSWWNMRSRARERNVGWRLDYFFITPDLKNNLTNAAIHQNIHGSDHCPVSINLAFPG